MLTTVRYIDTDVLVSHSFPGMADQAVKALGSAIEVSRRRAAAKADDPFYPDSFKKESVPAALENIQIDREDLTGVEVLGAGQFGRVYVATLPPPSPSYPLDLFFGGQFE